MTRSTPRAERPAMAAYGVPDDPDGLLEWSWAEQRLLASRNLWLTSVSAAGRPQTLPLWGVWMPDRGLFGFSSATSSRRVANIGANPWVVVAVDDTVEVVSLEGRARRLGDDDPLLAEVIAAWATKYSTEMSASEAEIDSFLRQGAVVVVEPERAFGIIERPEDFARRATRWRW